MKHLIFLSLFTFCCMLVSAQNFSDYFTTYTPVYTPPRPVYTVPMPNIVDNSVTIIDNSYRPTTPSVTCVDTQKQAGQVLLIDLTNDTDMVVDAEVTFKTYSNNSVAISVNRIKLDNQWHSIGVSAYKLADLLNGPEVNRKDILKLLEIATFYAYSEDVLFLF